MNKKSFVVYEVYDKYPGTDTPRENHSPRNEELSVDVILPRLFGSQSMRIDFDTHAP